MGGKRGGGGRAGAARLEKAAACGQAKSSSTRPATIPATCHDFEDAGGRCVESEASTGFCERPQAEIARQTTPAATAA